VAIRSHGRLGFLISLHPPTKRFACFCCSVRQDRPAFIGAMGIFSDHLNKCLAEELIRKHSIPMRLNKRLNLPNIKFLVSVRYVRNKILLFQLFARAQGIDSTPSAQ
jgi:hypothetical protein